MLTTSPSSDPIKALWSSVLIISMIALTGFLTFGIYLKVNFLVNRAESFGRVIKWEGDLVYMRYAAVEGDSIVSGKQLPYLRDKQYLADLERIPVIYHRNKRRKFEIRGVDESGYLSVGGNLLVSLLVGGGTLWWLRRYRNQYRLHR